MLIEKIENRNVTDENEVEIRDYAPSQTKEVMLKNAKPGLSNSKDNIAWYYMQM